MATGYVLGQSMVVWGELFIRERANFNKQTASYTFVFDKPSIDDPYFGDEGKVVSFNSASAVNATVPPNSSAPFALGVILKVYNEGAGAVTFVAGSGVTIENNGATLTTGKWAFLIKVGINKWSRMTLS